MEVRMWNLARTQLKSRITGVSHLQENEPGLVGYFRLDDAQRAEYQRLFSDK
jgi:hypothetical protein